MIVSLNFIEKFLTLPRLNKKNGANQESVLHPQFDVETIANILTKQGFEVESVLVRGAEFNLVVVGKIVNAVPHPQSEKLQICDVSVGNNKVLKIVCGAQNARTELFVAVALVGANLPGDLSIKPTQIRGVESSGMLCSREELGLPILEGVDGNGIWELDVLAQGGKPKKDLEHLIGRPVFDALGLSDIILDLNVTPNRPDVLCHEGVARELAAGFVHLNIAFEKKIPSLVLNEKLNAEQIRRECVKEFELKKEGISFSAENHLNAPAFFMMIDHVKVEPSPAWLRNLLESLGQSSINNIVDISNYILLAYGQPSHAFDFDEISSSTEKNKKIKIRLAQAGESFIGLDGKERILHEADAVVADEKTTLALLGVLGGQSSKVVEKSSSLIVEFANPDRIAVRRTSRRHGRKTDASFLFEKGIDAENRFTAAAEFVALLQKISSVPVRYLGSCHSKNLKKQPVLETEFQKRVITYSSSDQKRILGSNIIGFEKQLAILNSLGFEIQNKTDSACQVVVPSWRRHDIDGAADLVEEFIRVVGIDTITAQPIVSASVVRPDDLHFSFIESICQCVSALGYNEVIGLHFMRLDDAEKLNLRDSHALGVPVALLNPIIGDEPLLHTSLIPDLLRKVERNISYGTKSGQLFHSCRTYQNMNQQGRVVFGSPISILNETLCEYGFEWGYQYAKGEQEKERPVETPRLAGVCFGNREEKEWRNQASVAWSIFDLMGHVHELGRRVGVSLEFCHMSQDTHTKEKVFHPMASSLHPGRSLALFACLDQKRVPIGWCGELHPKVLRNYDISEICFAFEINLANLIRVAHEQEIKIKKVVNSQKLPVVMRDFAFILDDKVTARDIELVASASVSSLLEELKTRLAEFRIFDVYKGKGVSQGKKSIAFSLSFEPLEKTLTEKDIQKVTTAVFDAVKERLGGEIRQSESN